MNKRYSHVEKLHSLNINRTPSLNKEPSDQDISRDKLSNTSSRRADFKSKKFKNSLSVCSTHAIRRPSVFLVPSSLKIPEKDSTNEVQAVSHSPYGNRR